MTVQDLITELEKIEDKTLEVYYSGIYENCLVEEIREYSCDESCEIKVELS